MAARTIRWGMPPLSHLVYLVSLGLNTGTEKSSTPEEKPQNSHSSPPKTFSLGT